MPLPQDPKVNETANNLVNGLRGAFNTPNAHRPAHAKGRLVKGVFTPTPAAALLSKAPHFSNTSTPVIVRFSNSTGLPDIPDNDANASPQGMALRFVLGKEGHWHTDIVTHSTSFFPVRTGEEFLKLLGALGDGSIGEFLEANPAAAAFVGDPKPPPVSFATQKFFGINAFKFVAGDGKETFVRYRIVPVAGYSKLTEDAAKETSPSYLFDELTERVGHGAVTFKLVAQIAEEGDVTDDATKYWPEERKVVELGTIKLEELESIAESDGDQKKIIYDPIPRVDGIEPSADPLLDMRAAIYLLSGRIRRAAE